MKRYIFILIAAVAVGVFFFTNKETPRATVKTLNSKKLFLGPRQKIVLDSVSSGQAALDKRCSNLLNILDELDFSRSDLVLQDEVSLAEVDSCNNVAFSSRLEQLKKACFGKEFSKPMCEMNLVMLRSLIRSQGILDPANQEELADMIISEFSKPEPDFKKLQELASKLMDMNDSKAIQRLWVMTKVIAEVERVKKNPDAVAEEVLARIDAGILDEKNSHDLRMVLKTGLKPERISNYMKEMIAKDPNDYYSHEMLGWAYWKSGNKSGAIAELKRAIELNPQDPWLKSMYSEVIGPHANKDTYQGRIRFGLKYDDLF